MFENVGDVTGFIKRVGLRFEKNKIYLNFSDSCWLNIAFLWKSVCKVVWLL